MAITQPALDLLGRNPEFFIAGGYTESQIVHFALVVALVPSAIAVGLFVVARLVHRRVGNAIHWILLGLLGALFGNVLARGLGADGTVVAIVASILGAAAASGLARAKGGRLLLQYLAMANVLFLVGFLVVSPVSQLLQGGVDPEAIGPVTVPVPPGPIVFIVFDELPLATLMRDDGTINAERYPAFARLAAGSTWYRNASSVHSRTERAVPALMTGTVLNRREMPTYNDLPRNLLSLFSTAMPVERYEAVTDLCPPETCEERPGQPLRQTLTDASIVFGHRVLPPSLREDLAPIDDAWGSFGDGLEATAPPAEEGDDVFATANPLARYRAFDDSERSPEAQALHVVEQGFAIDQRPTLHFVHVVFPHAPWWTTPWGTRVMPPLPATVQRAEEPGFAWSALSYYQRHSMQVGTADVALGQVLDQIERVGAWDNATIVVTADHGTSTIPPGLGRDAPDANADDVYRVPMFFKAPGQVVPVVSDDVALTVDVLPTLIDLLDVETTWTMDGHSLLDGSAPTLEPLVTSDVDGLFAVVRRHQADFPRGWDWTALAAVGEHGDLVGTALADVEVGDPSRLSWAPTNEGTFRSLPNAAGEMPQVMTGRISGTVPGIEPPPLVIVANGTVAGATGGYLPAADGWSFNSTLGPYLVDGANQIEAYEVTTDTGRPVLHLVG